MDIHEQRKLAGIYERGPGHKPEALTRCVTDVAPKYDNDTSRAFAICTASLQKAGVLKKGTNEPTKRGKARSKKMSAKKDSAKKHQKYEKLLKHSRMSEWRSKSAKAVPAQSGTEGEFLGFAESVTNLDSQVAALISEDYKLLSGISPSVKAFKAKAWEAHEEPQDINKRPVSAWERVIAKKGFKAEPGLQYASSGDEDATMKALRNALMVSLLPVTDGTDRQAEPSEFMYQGRHVDDSGKTCWAHFKHRGTRNRIHLDLVGQRLLVPVRKALFQYGTFDKVEHIDLYSHLRTLSGIR